MRHMPAGTCHGPLVRYPGKDARAQTLAAAERAAAPRLSPQSSQPRPITVSAALTNSRCRTQAQSAAG